MKKQKVNVEADYDLHWENGVDLDVLEKDIKELRKLGVSRVDIYAYTSYNEEYVSIRPMIERLENDEEFQNRINKDNLKKKQELEMLKWLKEKYANLGCET